MVIKHHKAPVEAPTSTGADSRTGKPERVFQPQYTAFPVRIPRSPQCFVLPARTRCHKHGKDRKGNASATDASSAKKTVQDVAYKPFGNMRIDPRTACFCLRLLAEGNSIRSTERLTGIHRDTILKLLEFAGRRCKKLLEGMIVDLDVDDVQADEIWVSSTGRKSAQSARTMAMRGRSSESSVARN